MVCACVRPRGALCLARGALAVAIVLAPWRVQADPSAELEATWAEANSAIKAEAHVEAEAALTRLMPIAVRDLGEQDPTVGTLCYLLASQIMAQGRPGDARPWYERALAIRRQALGEWSRETEAAYLGLGQALDELRLPDEAEPALRQAVAIMRRVGGDDDPYTVADTLQLAHFLRKWHRPAEAEPLYRAVVEQRRRPGSDPGGLAAACAGLGETLDDLGRHAEARPLLVEALEIRRRVSGDDVAATADAYSLLARNLLNQHRPAEAAPLFDAALQIRRRVFGENHESTARSYQEAGNSLESLGRYAEAATMFRHALAIDRELYGDEHEETAYNYANLGWALFCVDRKDPEAQPLVEKALSIQRRVLGEDDLTTALSYERVAEVGYLARGRVAEALPLLEQALAIQQRLNGEAHPRTINALETLAFWELAVPERRAAGLVHARAAVELVREHREALPASAAGEEQQIRDARPESFAFLTLADALWLDTATPLMDRAAEVLWALQDSIATSATAAVARMSARFAPQDDALRRLARERQDLAERLARNDDDLVATLSRAGTAGPTAAEALRAEERQLQEDLARVDAELRTRFPQYFDLVNPSALEGSDIVDLLADDEGLLIVVPGLRGTHVFAVTRRDGTWFRATLTEHGVAAAVARLRCDLDAEHCASGAAADGTRGATRSDAPRHPARLAAFDRRTAYELYHALIEPTMPVFAGVRNVYVVTTGPLTSLPLSVLVTEEPRAGEDDSDPEVLRNTPWLLRMFATTSLPSASSLKALRAFRRSAGSKPPAIDFIGFGDPLFSGTGGADRGATRASSLFRGVAANGAGIADPDALRHAFPPLPGTRAELEAMAAAFAPRARILLGTEATESAVKHTDLERVAVVAFSTHGLVAGEIDGIAEPGLVLTPPRAASADDDGFLAATEVAQLRLDADWVILSACNTAASDGTPGADALSGLARAFFYAGARSLLVSHWSVRDDVASVLTVDVIRRQRAHPEMGRAEALRQAALAVLDSSTAGKPAFAHPAAWAPFTLVGEGR